MVLDLEEMIITISNHSQIWPQSTICWLFFFFLFSTFQARSWKKSRAWKCYGQIIAWMVLKSFTILLKWLWCIIPNEFVFWSSEIVSFMALHKLFHPAHGEAIGWLETCLESKGIQLNMILCNKKKRIVGYLNHFFRSNFQSFLGLTNLLVLTRSICQSFNIIMFGEPI